MKLISTATAALTALLTVQVTAQAPNTVAKTYPHLRTASSNTTYFVIPISDANAAKIAAPYKLAPVPRNDKSIFPNGFPANSHPVILNSGYMNDIRMTAGVPLAIPALLSSGGQLSYVDRLGDGTPFNKPLTTFIGGIKGQNVQGVVPALVGSGEGNTIFVGQFDPNDAAYKSLGGGQLSAQSKQIILPNPISGPGVTPSAIDYAFQSSSQTPYTLQTFRTLVNQPTILTNGLCQQNTQFFNESFADPLPRTGSVTLYSPALPAALTGGFGKAKTYQGANVGGLSVTVEMVGFNAAGCAKVAMRGVDGV